MSSPYPPSYRSDYPNPYDRPPPSTSPNPNPNQFHPVQPYQPSSQLSTSQPPFSTSPSNAQYQSQYNPNSYNAPYSGGPPGPGLTPSGRPSNVGPGPGMGNMSPDDEDVEEDNAGFVDWQKLKDWRFWLRKKWIPWYILGIVLIVLTALMTIYHTQIVNWLKPAATWMRDLPAGWTIPVVILFVISFPPLFGHEIVAVLCGVVWGLWIGFAIVALGTFLGEIGNFYAFKYCCRARSEKHEKTTPWYACLARVVREGGFKVALIVRLSAIPGHFTTAVFATCGMSIWVFCLAAALSLPKQFVTVYLGYILEQSGTGNSEPTSSKIISDVIVALSVLITIAAGWWILRKMKQVRPSVMREIRRAKRAEQQFTYKAQAVDPEAGGSQENLWSSEFNASSVTLTDPAKGGQARVEVKPYGNYSDNTLAAGQPGPGAGAGGYDLPRGAAPPFSQYSSNSASASGSRSNTPSANAPSALLAASAAAGPTGPPGGRRYQPPSQNQQAYGASAEDLQIQMEPIRAAPGSLDTGYGHVPSAPPFAPPPGAPQAQAQRAYAPPAGAPSYAQGGLSNPFDDRHASPISATPPAGLVSPVPQHPPSGLPSAFGAQAGIAQPRQPTQQQAGMGADAPFPVMTAQPGGGQRPRGVQLHDG